jgi:hypothetical protein
LQFHGRISGRSAHAQDEVKEINGCRKERRGAKRTFLKDKPVVSTEEVEMALRKMEKATASKTTKKGKGKRSTKKRVVSSEEEIDSSTDDSSDLEEPLAPKIFDCIEVA